MKKEEKLEKREDELANIYLLLGCLKVGVPATMFQYTSIVNSRRLLGPRYQLVTDIVDVP